HRALSEHKTLSISWSHYRGIVQNWLMNMAGYDLYKQAPALVDNVLRMFMPDENITKLIHQTNELSVM
ncbi:hypothetical protein HC625_20145, partial [Escherichia coli]|nr:hypothetical protein [Escherichia coli]